MNLIQGFGSALALSAIVGAILTAVVLFTLALLWRGFLSDRTSNASASSRGSLRSLLRALAMCVGQLFLLFLFGRLTDHRAEDPEGLDVVGILSNATVAVPAGALSFAIARLMSASWPRVRTGFYAVAALLTTLAALAGFSQILRFRQYDRLPSPIVELAGDVANGCARLQDGRVACIGSNREGQRGHGYSPDANRPTLVRGLDDAIALYGGESVFCALSRSGTTLCWGGCDTLQPRPRCLSPWPLPGGAGATALAVTGSEVAGLRADGSTFGWPRPLPPALSRVRMLRGTLLLIHQLAICGIDLSGVGLCFQVDAKGGFSELKVYAQLGEVRDIAQLARDQVCAIRKDGRLVCVGQSGKVEELTIDNAERLIPLTGWDWAWWSCAVRRGAPPACWNGTAMRTLDELSSPADALFAWPPKLCARNHGVVRCAALDSNDAGAAANLLHYAPSS